MISIEGLLQYSVAPIHLCRFRQFAFRIEPWVAQVLKVVHPLVKDLIRISDFKGKQAISLDRHF